MKIFVYILFILISLITVSKESIIREVSPTILLTTNKKYEAGAKIVLKFKSLNNLRTSLCIHHSFGCTIITSKKIDSIHEFTIPASISNKTGLVNWTFGSSETYTMNGSFNIEPSTILNNSLDSFVGPRIIQAGSLEETMLIVVPTDLYDNPLQNNSLVKMHWFYEKQQQSIALFTNNLVAWKSIASPLKKGSIFISSSIDQISTKEHIVEVYAATPQQFELFYKQNHPFADGNQLTHIYTSAIKDSNGNIISDGTLVMFNIINTNGTIINSYGTTIRGIASTQALHPVIKDSWKVTAYIQGFAKSNECSIVFLPAVKKFQVSFSDNQRSISVGPIKSFTNQLIPDGIRVKLFIYSGKELQEVKSSDSKNGLVKFHLNPNFYSKSNYSFKLETMGISSKLINVTYENDRK